MTDHPRIAPPAMNLDAEQSVIGAVLLSCNTARPLIEQGLLPAHFYRTRHRILWQAIMDMTERAEHVDVLTLTARLLSTGRLDEVGGKAEIDVLCGAVPGLGGVRDYARIVMECARWRWRATLAYEQLNACAAFDEAAYARAVARVNDPRVSGREPERTGLRVVPSKGEAA